MRRHRLLALILTTLTSTIACLPAADLSFESGPRKTRLLELYTSEGCSSCPPAEAWLSRLKDDGGLWRDFIPIAFHVDYWDRLGWRDPFASKAWTARQYQYSSRWNADSVYTPAFVLDGREWHNNGAPAAAGESPGVLKISLANDQNVTGSFQPVRGGSNDFELHVARLGFGLNSNVKAGENSGRKLQHDFVVLALADAKLVGGKTEVALPDGAGPSNANSRGALVAWVTAPGQLEPIQAVGGWIK